MKKNNVQTQSQYLNYPPIKLLYLLFSILLIHFDFSPFHNPSKYPIHIHPFNQSHDIYT